MYPCMCVYLCLDCAGLVPSSDAAERRGEKTKVQIIDVRDDDYEGKREDDDDDDGDD